jgi:formylmethanofuran dehydrogenase subunit B
VVRSFGMFVTTPNEARVRSDVVLLIGSGLAAHWPGIWERLALHLEPRFNPGPRKVIWLGAKRNEAARIDGVEVETINATPDEIPEYLAALRARVGGRPVALSLAATKKIDAVAATLKAAKFGAAVWAAAALDPLTVEMLQGLMTTLNETTRFTGVPIGGRAGASGAVQVSGWMTGFPPRTGFGRGYPEHDPWRFKAARLVDSGVADAALWISAFDGEAPPWENDDIPLVTLAPAGRSVKRGLHIEVGRPGVSHDATEFAQETGSFVLRRAQAPGEAPSVAEAIEAISARFSEDVPC